MKLQTEPAAEAAATRQFPAELGGGADEAVLLALEDAGDEEGGAGTAMRLQPGKKMEKKMIVKVGDDEVSGGDGVPQNIFLLKADTFANSVQAEVPFCLLHG